MTLYNGGLTEEQKQYLRELHGQGYLSYEDLPREHRDALMSMKDYEVLHHDVSRMLWDLASEAGTIGGGLPWLD